MPMRREQIAAALQYLGNKADLKKRAERTLSLDPQPEADLGDITVDVLGGSIPGVNLAQAVRDFERARRESDTVGMGLSTLAGVPVIGGVAKAANVARKAGKLQDIAEGAVQTGRMSPTTASELAEAERLADAQAIAKQVGLNTRKAEGANNLLLKSLGSENLDFRHDDARAAIERMQGLLQSRTQQNNPLKSRLNAAYQYSNSIGGMTKPDAAMSPMQRKVLSGILRGDIVYDEAGELRRIK